MIMGTTPDISSLIDYDFYEPIWYYDELSQFPEPKRKIARWLGEAHNIGQAMTYYILPLLGIPIIRSSVQAITPEERLKDAVRDELRELDNAIRNKYPMEHPDNVPDYFSHENSNIHPRRTTKGWQLCALWKDGSTSWESLKDMKEAFKVQVDEYSISRGIQDRMAFRWWVPSTLKRRERIVKAMKSRYVKRTHKYGIRLPKTTEEACQIDKETNTDYWHQAILKEMKNNMVAFKFLEEGETIPVGSKLIPFHMIFDIKLDLTRKARFVMGGHWTDPPTQVTYSSVVTRESVRIAFMIAALNELDILSADIGNAYLQAPVREKVHTTAGPEFGPQQVGQTVIVVRAMYGLKSSGAAWHAQLSSTLHDMNFTPSLADPDVWIRPSSKPSREEYYEYILVYVDDILIFSHDPNQAMTAIRLTYRLKEEPTPPKTYLGATIKEWRIPGDTQYVWSMNSQRYIKEVIRCLEMELQK